MLDYSKYHNYKPQHDAQYAQNGILAGVVDIDQYRGSTRKYISVLKPHQSNDRYATYFKKYGQNIIDKSDDYYLAIDRFNIPCITIPIMIFDSTPNFYTVTLDYNGFSSGPTTVQYIPWSSNLPTTSTEYYYVYSFDLMLKMINNALATAFTALSGLTTLPTGSQAPYFYMNHTSNIIHYVAQKDFYDEDLALANRILTYVGVETVTLFYGLTFNIDMVGGPYKTHRMITFNTGNNKVTSTPSDLYDMASNTGAATAISWNVCKGLVITSDHIPVNTEDLPSGTGVLLNTSGLLNSRGIVANFDFIYSALAVKPLNVQYILSSVYKLIDLTGSSPINTIDVKMYWYDEYNNFYPLILNHGTALTIRFVFIKKATPN